MKVCESGTLKQLYMFHTCLTYKTYMKGLSFLSTLYTRGVGPWGRAFPYLTL